MHTSRPERVPKTLISRSAKWSTPCIVRKEPRMGVANSSQYLSMHTLNTPSTREGTSRAVYSTAGDTNSAGFTLFITTNNTTPTSAPTRKRATFHS